MATLYFVKRVTNYSETILPEIFASKEAAKNKCIELTLEESQNHFWIEDGYYDVVSTDN